MIAYPKLDVEKWRNAKLTIKEREEVDNLVNHSGWSVKRVAEMYGVTQMTIKYWSDPEYRKKDNARTTKRMKINMMDPAFKKKQTDRQKLNTAKRYREDPAYREWVRHGRSNSGNITPESRAKNTIRASKRYHGEKQESIKMRARRQYRAQNLNGFRMFMKHINIPSYADNTCYKKETRSISSYKRKNVSTTKSLPKMAKRLHISLQHITKTILQPIHVLKRVFSNE